MYNNFKRAAVLSPRQQQWDELRSMQARLVELDRQAQARAKVTTRPTANRAQGNRQGQHSRTKCENCWSSAILVHENVVECLVCKTVSERWYRIDVNRYPGEVACKHCHSISVVLRGKSLHCKVCGEDSPRWP